MAVRRVISAVLTVLLLTTLLLATPALAGVGDPQAKTDHPWYPGELSCSTFERLFATQADLYRRVTGRSVDTDEDKALASWYWRNLNLAHGEDGHCDLFGQGFDKSDWNREYWAGLFAHGFALCGTTHAQYTAEINHLLGHCRGRAVGVSGHNSFEAFLTGGPYGEGNNGKWALLDHDVSTVVFDAAGQRLLSIQEISANLAQFRNPDFKPERQRGWRVAGLHPNDAAVYDSFNTVEYLSGYAALPPMVHLRSGESLRRYLEPGLDDGKTFVFWGRNYGTAGIPGPERSRAWVNQPEKMYRATSDTGHQDGRVRYANAVYTYKSDFKTAAYKEAAVEEGPGNVTLEFRSPYVIACTPPNNNAWGVYEPGGKDGLVVSGLPSGVNASISVDRGRSWTNPASGATLDLTDAVKGGHQYWLRLSHEAADAGGIVAVLKKSPVTIRTVCQTNVATIPHLKDGKNQVTFQASGHSAISAGPNLAQAQTHVVDGAMDTPKVTLELKTPRGEKAVRLYAAAWTASGNPPGPTKFQIEYSADAGKTWKPVVKDWSIIRREPEPGDFWSQSFCWGDADLPGGVTGPVPVRFSNDGGKTYRKAEAHLAYAVTKPSATQVTFAWSNAAGPSKTATHAYPAAAGKADASWSFDAGKDVKTLWVEYAAK
jgi:hypothetical protein